MLFHAFDCPVNTTLIQISYRALLARLCIISRSHACWCVEARSAANLRIPKPGASFSRIVSALNLEDGLCLHSGCTSFDLLGIFDRPSSDGRPTDSFTHNPFLLVSSSPSNR